MCAVVTGLIKANAGVCRYQHYLESVLEVTPECHEINDLIARHATLEASNQDLKEQQRQAGESTEQVRYIEHHLLLPPAMLYLISKVS